MKPNKTTIPVKENKHLIIQHTIQETVSEKLFLIEPTIPNQNNSNTKQLKNGV